MSNDQDTRTSTVLVHVEDAAENIRGALQRYQNSEITAEQLDQEINEYMPKLDDVGVTLDEETDKMYVNTKPVPKNAEAAMYFHYDDDNVLRTTIRFLNFGDNEHVDNEHNMPITEMAAVDVMRLIAMEHQSVLNTVFMRSMMDSVSDDDDEHKHLESDDPLAAIEDPATREQVRKFTKH